MYTLGIDIGSTTSKCAVIQDGTKLTATSLQTGGLGTGGPEDALAELWSSSGLTASDMARTIVTGYGRKNYEGADGEISELTAHALGGRFVFPDLRTVIDIGGQDAKVISLGSNGQMMNFVMNDKCAAGTGRFLDVMAGILQLDIGELEKEAAKSETAAKISSTCTVFAESEVISQLANGAAREDVVAGICNSVAARVAALAKRIGIKEEVFMSGGVAQNGGVRLALERELNVSIHYSEFSQLMGAYGAALFACIKATK